MSRMSKKVYRIRVILCIGICLIGIGAVLRLCAQTQGEETWYKHEALAKRLASEWYKLGVLKSDLAAQADLLTDLRNLQLFPQSITLLTEDNIITIDKNIEKLEKQHQLIIKKVNQFTMPLSDAIAILREMTVGEPVEDMFSVIEQGDMERIEDMLEVKHQINDLWNDINTLIQRINNAMRFPSFRIDSIYGVEKEFFDILNANLGLQSQEYINKMECIIDSLAQRASQQELYQLYKIEMHRLNQILGQRRYDMAQKKIMKMRSRYKEKKYFHQLNAMLTRVYFSLREYTEALRTARSLPDEPIFVNDKILYTVQSWYALQEYQKIWDWASVFDYTLLKGRYKNLIIWLVMESGLALGIDTDFTSLADRADNSEPYSLQILHTLGRTYYFRKENEIAHAVFTKALNMQLQKNSDKLVSQKILLTDAQLLFEMGEYQSSLEQFFRLLKDDKEFEDALFGIAWCYIKLRKYSQAEVTLRKLINQSPHSLRAAEALFVMAKRYITKAQYEWNKLIYVSNEEKRLIQMSRKLSDMIRTEGKTENNKRYAKALDEVRHLLEQIKKEPRHTDADIRSYYKKAKNLCNIIVDHYETGSFQETIFSEERENVLHKLDSLTFAITYNQTKDFFSRTDSSSYQQQVENILEIKKIVKKSYILISEIDLNNYKWEQEYLDWQKTLLNDTIQQVSTRAASLTDPASIKQYQRSAATYKHRIDSLVTADSISQSIWHDYLTRLLLQLLSIDLDSSDEINVRYHLGELYYQRENNTYIKAIEQYEHKMVYFDSLRMLFNKGKMAHLPEEPQQPVLSHAESMEQFKLVIKRYPNHYLSGACRYSLAWCYNDINQFDSAVAQMKRITDEHGEFPYIAQAFMFLGEYYFDIGKLDSAMSAYRSVMKYPESEWFDDALYKLAWTQYRLSNPEKAISSFLALVDLGKKEKAGKALLEKESIDYIAISFSESDLKGNKGLKRALLFCQHLGDDEKGMQILERLAGVYEEQGRYAVAKETYETLLRMYPLYHRSPLIEHRFIAMLSKEMALEKANEYKIDFFNKYNRNSTWYRSHTDSLVRKMADSLSAENLYDASVVYHQLALQKNDTQLFHKTITLYREYVDFYSTSPKANECHYNIAEILFSLGDYSRAAQEYIAVSRNYPESKYRETAAWNAIVASQQLLKQQGEADE